MSSMDKDNLDIVAKYFSQDDDLMYLVDRAFNNAYISISDVLPTEPLKLSCLIQAVINFYERDNNVPVSALALIHLLDGSYGDLQTDLFTRAKTAAELTKKRLKSALFIGICIDEYLKKYVSVHGSGSIQISSEEKTINNSIFRCAFTINYPGFNLPVQLIIEPEFVVDEKYLDTELKITLIDVTKRTGFYHLRDFNEVINKILKHIEDIK